MRECKNCFYFAQDEKSIENKIGRCYANPPTVMLMPAPTNMFQKEQNQLVLQSIYPAVQETDVCRFFESVGGLDEN